MIHKLSHLFRPEETRLTLEEGNQVQRYQHSYHQALHRINRIKVDSLLPEYQKMGSSLHRGVESKEVIISAFLYACNRLPDCMPLVQEVVVASSLQTLQDHGLGQITAWQQVQAEKRRRTAFFDGRQRLVVLVTSLSDLDDLIPGLCAYQIEWNKMHRRLIGYGPARALADKEVRASEMDSKVRNALGLNRADHDAIRQLWGRDWDRKIAALAAGGKDITLQILPLREKDFRHLAREWWEGVMAFFDAYDVRNRPVYLVTSNNHSLVNLALDFGDRHTERIRQFAAQHCSKEFNQAMARLEDEDPLASRNMLYLAQAQLLAKDEGFAQAKQEMESEAGIQRTKPLPPLLAEAQLIELGRLRPHSMDPRLRLKDPGKLSKSRAVIFNTDYPLGFAAFHLLKTAAHYLHDWRGLFILGKSAAMIGRLGDILIPSQVRDIHSKRLYCFKNCFSARNLIPHLCDSAVFDDQRSLTVQGTFLHSWDTVRDLHRADFTGIEMEAGPCLAAVRDLFQAGGLKDASMVEIQVPLDFHLGILHYSSDTPYNLRASLLSRPLGLTGLEATYSCSLAIMQYILDQECHPVAGAERARRSPWTFPLIKRPRKA